jgi:hypothetical protein
MYITRRKVNSYKKKKRNINTCVANFKTLEFLVVQKHVPSYDKIKIMEIRFTASP